jgi:hypothetical protein
VAFDEAARFLAMSVTAAQRAGAGIEQRAELLLELATAEFRAGQILDSLRHAAEASDAAAVCRRADLLTEAALTVHDVDAQDVLREVIRLAERALSAPDADRSPPSTPVCSPRSPPP